MFCLESQAVANRVHKAKVDATLLDRNEARDSALGLHSSGLLLQCKVAAIHSLEVPLALTNEPPTNTTLLLTEIPLQIELTGSSTSVLKLLQNLPLRADEMRAAGLTNAPPDKAPLFIDRLVLKKQSPENPDEVRLSLRAVGFVLRE